MVPTTPELTDQVKFGAHSYLNRTSTLTLSWCEYRETYTNLPPKTGDSFYSYFTRSITESYVTNFKLWVDLKFNYQTWTKLVNISGPTELVTPIFYKSFEFGLEELWLYTMSIELRSIGFYSTYITLTLYCDYGHGCL